MRRGSRSRNFLPSGTRAREGLVPSLLLPSALPTSGTSEEGFYDFSGYDVDVPYATPIGGRRGLVGREGSLDSFFVFVFIFGPEP